MLAPLPSVVEAFLNSFYKDFFLDMYVGNVDAGTGYWIRTRSDTPSMQHASYDSRSLFVFPLATFSPALFLPLSLFSDSTVANICVFTLDS